MKIALGSDHHGRDAVAALARHLEEHGHVALVLGPETEGAVDYPESAHAVAHAVADGDADRGVLICGSGIGMSMAANKVDGVRAALVFDEEAAEMTRRHNDANVIALSGGRTEVERMAAILDAFLAAPFDGGRHARRVDQMGQIERGEQPGGAAVTS